MDPTQNPSASSATASSDASSAESLHAQLSTIERAAQAAHSAIDRLASKADDTFKRVRNLTWQARLRFQDGCKNYSRWEDECIENTRERIRAKPLTAVTIGVLIGLLIGRTTRSR